MCLACPAQNLIHGLNDRPPHVDILTRAFDTALPGIDEASIAPLLAQQSENSPSPLPDDATGAAAAAADGSGSDEFSTTKVLKLQHENAKLRAQLASLTALCANPDSGMAIKRSKSRAAAATSPAAPADGAVADKSTAAQPEGSKGNPTLRQLSLQLIDQAATLTLSDDAPTPRDVDAELMKVKQAHEQTVAEVATLRRQCSALQSLKDRITYKRCVCALT